MIARKLLEEEKARKAAEEAKIDDAPLVLKFLQETRNVTDDHKEAIEASETEITETLLKELKHDFEALKHSARASDEDEITLKSETGETKVARDILFGTPDPSAKPSDVPCGGCGAMLHCQDTGIPGFVPQEKFKGLSTNALRSQLCQRCTLMKDEDYVIHYGVDKYIYPQIVRKIRQEKALVVMVVDVTDMGNSIIKDYLKKIGKNTPVVIVGNKIDLIPKDVRGYLNGIGRALADTALKANLNPQDNNIKHVCLVSAKTGYGIEDLVSKLIRFWENNGNVYLVGTTNSGKSSLFNIFLQSDYCKSSVRDFMQRATVSQWPGTTLNLLKFPIIKPTYRRLALRTNRLKKTKIASAKNDMLRKEKWEQYKLNKYAIREELVEKTDFRLPEKAIEESKLKQTCGDTFATYSLGEKGEITAKYKSAADYTEATQIVTDEHFPNSHWLFDTPGLVNEDQLITRLTADELRAVLPNGALRPRVFLLKEGYVMFVSGLARIDCIEAPIDMCICTFTSLDIPVHIVPAAQADEFYATNVGTKVLGVPIGDEDRLNKLPSLAGQEFSMVNESYDHVGMADIQLSSLGWITPLLRLNESFKLRIFTPGGYGMYVRQPCLIRNVLLYKGNRKKGSFAYGMKKLIGN